MARKPGTLCRFTCVECGGISLVTGGTNRFTCDACKTAAGRQVGRTPQKAAHKAVADAIKAGTLARPSEFPCEDCAGPAIEYDHRDYSKPLEVAPVCRGCNLRRGPAIGKSAPLSAVCLLN